MTPPFPRVALGLLVLAVAGCAASIETEPQEESTADLVKTEDAHWVYDGPLEPLDEPTVTVALHGHTARLSGYLKHDADLAALPHLRKTPDNGRIRVDLVYPIATGAKAEYNARPGRYPFQDVRPYRPRSRVVNEFGDSWVSWGGFPFLNYDGGVAMHGPISDMTAKDNSNLEVFYLRRGRVSHGCNRMLGEHVTELTHALGISMRRLYEGGRAYPPPKSSVTLTPEFDTLGGKLVDVDYPTDVTDSGTIRPKTTTSSEQITMFGSWVASELPDGSDLPPDMKWEAGEKNDPYVFSEHVRRNWVCSIPKADLDRAGVYARSQPNGELPRGFCAKKDCVLGALRSGREVHATCGL